MRRLLFLILLLPALCYASDDIEVTPSAYTYKVIFDLLYLKLDQSTPQTVTASPIWNWGTSTRVPYYSGTKTLTDDADLTFDGTTLTAGGFNTIGTATIGNGTTGTLDLTGLVNDVSLFNDILVGDGTDAPSLYVRRHANEGDHNLRLYVDKSRYVHFDISYAGILNWNNAQEFNLGGDSGGTLCFGADWGTSNMPVKHFGYITAVGAEKYVQWKVDDTDDYFHLTRQDANILGFNVDMPFSIGNGTTSAGVLAINEDTSDGVNNATFTVPTLAADTDYILPPDDGDAGEQLQTNGTGTLTWEAAGAGGSGDSITVNTTAIDTTADFTDSTDVTWAITDGGAGGPDVVKGYVADDSHAHTGASLSGIDISADTNLTAGDFITLTDDDLDVDTAAVSNGDVTHLSTADAIYDFVVGGWVAGAGVFDFGGATSLEVPNGANPTTDAAGEIAVDSSAAPGSGIRFYGDAAYTIAGTYSKSFVILNPVATDDYPVWRVPYNITITAVHLQCLGNQITGHLVEMDANGLNAAGVDGATDITGVVNENVNDDTALSNPTIDSGDYLGFRTTSITGTPTSATITWEYKIDQVN